MTVRKLRLAVALLTFGTSAGEAQAERGLGLVIGHPGDVGLLWHLGQLPLRADLAYSRTTDSRQGLESGSWSATSGLSVLLLVARIDSLRGYFVPRVSYRHQGANGYTPFKTYSVDGGFGVQHDLARRLTVYGEAGLRYSYLSRRVLAPTGDELPGGHSSTWSTIAGVGLMLYLR